MRSEWRSEESTAVSMCSVASAGTCGAAPWRSGSSGDHPRAAASLEGRAGDSPGRRSRSTAAAAAGPHSAPGLESVGGTAGGSSAGVRIGRADGSMYGVRSISSRSPLDKVRGGARRPRGDAGGSGEDCCRSAIASPPAHGCGWDGGGGGSGAVPCDPECCDECCGG